MNALSMIPAEIRATAPRTLQWNGAYAIDPQWVRDTIRVLQRGAPIENHSIPTDWWTAAHALCAREASPRDDAREIIASLLHYHPSVNELQIMRGERARRVTNARAHVCYEFHRRLGWSMPKIGGFLHRDHTTIMAAIRQWPTKAKALGIPCEPINGGAA